MGKGLVSVCGWVLRPSTNSFYWFNIYSAQLSYKILKSMMILFVLLRFVFHPLGVCKVALKPVLPGEITHTFSLRFPVSPRAAEVDADKKKKGLKNLIIKTLPKE